MPYCLLYGLKTEHIFCYRLYEWRITGWRWTSQSKVADFTADQSQVDKITAVLAWGGGLKGVSLFSLRTLQTTWEGGGGDPGLGFRSGQAKWSGPQNGLVPKNCPFGRYSRVLIVQGPSHPPLFSLASADKNYYLRAGSQATRIPHCTVVLFHTRAMHGSWPVPFKTTVSRENIS